MRSRTVNGMKRFMKKNFEGNDIFRPVKLRHLLAIIRKYIASVRPDIIAELNLPDPESTQKQIALLKSQIEEVKKKPQKKAEDYDNMQFYRRQIRTILGTETTWAVADTLKFVRVKGKGIQEDLDVALHNADLRPSDEFWKAFYYASRQTPAAASMDFANVYDISFKLLVRGVSQLPRKSSRFGPLF